MSEEWQSLSRDEKWQWILRDRDAKRQLEPVYQFNSRGDAIVLYDGPLGMAAGERSGTVKLVFGDKTWIRWNVEPDPHESFGFTEAVDLRLRRGGRDWTVTAQGNISDGGWIDHAEFVSPGAQLQRVIVHWINMPNIRARDTIETESADGTAHCWSGRWQFEVDGWRLTLDRRHDYKTAVGDTEVTSVFVLTHVMEVQRVDGSSFDVESAKQILECIRVCVSFAFGRWVAPALPVGYDSADQVVWEEWTAPICDRAQQVGAAWMFRVREDDLLELVKLALAAFLDPARPGITRFQMAVAVQSVETGFLEQRVLTAFPALENLAWVTLVLGGVVPQEQYERRWSGPRRLRELLKRAQIPINIDADVFPSLATFAATEKLRDGPAAVVAVRNRLVHPRNPNDEIYHLDDLVLDAWLLSRHYLNLLILHSIGYQGSYVNLFPGGRAWDAKPVPWTAVAP